MLKVSEMMGEDLIIEDLKANTKLEVLREFSALLARAGRVADKEGLTKVLVARETLGSTGIGDGIAIPHGKLPNIKDMTLAFGRSVGGVDFDSLDGEPAHLFFLLIAPENAPGDHLKALARVSRLMKNRDLRETLLQASTAGEIRRAIAEREE